MMPSTRARTSAVRTAATRPGSSTVLTTEVGAMVKTPTSGGGICGWPSPDEQAASKRMMGASSACLKGAVDRWLRGVMLESFKRTPTLLVRRGSFM
jgi:hypothetical protein